MNLFYQRDDTDCTEFFISRKERRERRLFIYQRDSTDSHGGIRDLGIGFL